MLNVRRVLVLVAAALLGAGLFAAPSAAAAPTNPYLFINGYSNLCLDVAYGSLDDGARVQQWDCYGGPPERWHLEVVESLPGMTYYRLRNDNSGRCLDVPDNTPGTGVHQWGCWGGWMQQWQVIHVAPNSLQLRNRQSGLCLDNRDWSLPPGTTIQQWHCNGAAVQLWRLA
ncbi:RICIN domain-containing protein [Actinosynnema sp. NPDC049800]